MSAADYSAESVATFDRHAARYAEKYFGLTDYDAHYAHFVASLPPGPCTVLDLACGPGAVAGYVRRVRPEVHLVCVDRSPQMLVEVQRRVPGAQRIEADLRDLHRVPLNLDGAAFCFGLSYLDDRDAATALAELHRVLRPGAPLLLTTVAGDPAQSGVQTTANGDRVHSFYRERPDIEARVRAAGFVLEHSALLPSPANASVVSTDVVLHARRV
ncbi:class I SAM-dependent DNA methyltransferase [Inhella gelatinilytica]|uniref:Class I SAM-dependent methyltransferase n=1 Tax=Inhella gelatinilytica TaxID=2795030 RepID=A0A931ITX9_9BURK|nr:class I SAM-dependent methyltransferase [Inhella gelatinilytica]MBH9551892.1 class I SAM-dependent methyltransferase [Inhella gelatinilytica]